MTLPAADRKALLARLSEVRGRLPQKAAPSALSGDLDRLLAKMRDKVAALSPPARPPLRSLHHLACTGGTLIAQCIGAQPNVQLLSEVDPLSPIAHSNPFVPTDMIGLARFASRPSEDDVMVDLFQAGLKVLYEAARRTGTALVLRDHSHSHFTLGPEIPDRPSLRDMMRADHDVLSLVTVRHPIDSFLSLQKNAWVHFTPDSFEEYCRRYMVFLDHYADADILRYEDFVSAPEHHMQWICDRFDLDYAPAFLRLHSAIPLSGSSGRSGHDINLRPRRAVSEQFTAEAGQSPSYEALCTRLGYAVDPSAPPLV